MLFIVDVKLVEPDVTSLGNGVVDFLINGLCLRLVEFQIRVDEVVDGLAEGVTGVEDSVVFATGISSNEEPVVTQSIKHKAEVVDNVHQVRLEAIGFRDLGRVVVKDIVSSIPAVFNDRVEAIEKISVDQQKVKDIEDKVLGARRSEDVTSLVVGEGNVVKQLRVDLNIAHVECNVLSDAGAVHESLPEVNLTLKGEEFAEAGENVLKTEGPVDVDDIEVIIVIADDRSPVRPIFLAVLLEGSVGSALQEDIIVEA